VVLADQLIARETEEPRQRIADHRGTQMPDVQLLGDVRS
jgi:hypothetical protein